MRTHAVDPNYKPDTSESVAEWVTINRRKVTFGVAGLAILFLGAWFYRLSTEKKAQNAEVAYYRAIQAAATGNPALAESDLRGVAQRYRGTLAGGQASIALAHSLYAQKKYQQGIDELSRIEGSSPDALGPSIHVLMAAGYEELKRFDNAAAEYDRAAELSRFDYDKSIYRASQARALMAGGKMAEARVIWADLADDPESPASAEARVRLGELTAKPAA